MNKSIDDPRILHGMEKQLQHRRDRLNAGEKAIGWKVGFGALSALERLQIEAPLIGFLTEKTLLPSGETVSITGWVKPAAEPEIAVYMGKDLVGRVDREFAQAAISSIGSAIELADVNFPPDDVERILAENIYNRHVILGHPDPSRAGCRLDDLEASVFRNGIELARTYDLQALTGDIIDIVCHLSNLLSVLGERLRTGEIIIAGSIIPPIWIEPNDRINYTLEPMSMITVNFR